jgi:hypothetical protein
MTEPAKHRSSEPLHFSSHDKIKAVLRLLRGESGNTVSQECGVSLRRLERWRDDFVAAGSAELSKRKNRFSWKESLHQRIKQISPWVALMGLLVLVIAAMAYLQNRSSP